MSKSRAEATGVERKTATGKATVQVSGWSWEALARRGARSHRGSGNAFSFSVVLARTLRTLEALLADADPRRVLPPAVYEAAMALLSEGWLLRPLEVQHLDEVLVQAEGFGRALEGAGVEAAVFREAIRSLSFGGKCALVDQAVQASARARAHAPGDAES
jgi:hypothetical protein